MLRYAGFLLCIALLAAMFQHFGVGADWRSLAEILLVIVLVIIAFRFGLGRKVKKPVNSPK